MPVTVVRFNLVHPAATPASLSARYKAAIEMAAYADDRGITTVQTEEHHGVANNWLPSPFAFAGAVFGATRHLAVTVSAVIGPLHDPLRLAEDIAVLDLLERRPPGHRRGHRLPARGVRPLRRRLEAARGTPGRAPGDGAEGVDRRGVHLPGPYGTGHTAPVLRAAPAAAGRRLVQGRGPARRPARAPLLPQRAPPRAGGVLQGAARRGTTEGWTMMPAAETPLLHIAEDPNRAWAEYGGHFLHEARTYASWQSGDIRSAVKSAATTVEELRAEGVYRILTPDQCVAQGLDNHVLHPLSGGCRSTRAGAACTVCGKATAPARGLSRAVRLTGTRRGAAGTWPFSSSLGASSGGSAHFLQRLALGLLDVLEHEGHG